LILPALSRPQRRDFQLIHHVLMVVVAAGRLRSASSSVARRSAAPWSACGASSSRAPGALLLPGRNHREYGRPKGQTHHTEP
jgi:hypothetical protein